MGNGTHVAFGSAIAAAQSGPAQLVLTQLSTKRALDSARRDGGRWRWIFGGLATNL